MAKLTKQKINTATERLLSEYKDAKCALDYDTNFQLLVAVVLSAQTTDVSVNKVTPALFAAAPDAFSMARLTQPRIEKYIKSIGLYKNKAKNVLLLSKQLVNEFNGEVPSDFNSLTSLPGVGRKTANVVLAELFGQQTIAVDTHVQRLSNRIGFVETDNPLDTELELIKIVPYECRTKMHHALILHGRTVCKAKKPNCSECCIKDICKKNGLA